MQHSPFYTQNEVRSFDFSPWGGIEGFLKASSQGAGNKGVALKQVVPDLSRAVDMTATAISSLPFVASSSQLAVFGFRLSALSIQRSAPKQQRSSSARSPTRKPRR